MLVKTILNLIEKHSSFVYQAVRLREGEQVIEIDVRPRRGTRPVCSGCTRRGSVYDTMPQREFQFVPLWGIAVFLLYSMRRVNCVSCGVHVESVPWAEGIILFDTKAPEIANTKVMLTVCLALLCCSQIPHECLRVALLDARALRSPNSS